MPFQACDLVVVGGGHAGVEAAAAAARLGCRTMLVTLNLEKIGYLSCNPAVGGVGKGQLVREADALGGLIGELADAACIQYRQLNTTRGAAVRSTRMQVDMARYQAAARARLGQIPNLQLLEDEVCGLLLRQGAVSGVRLVRNGEVACRAAVLAPGTFFRGLIHIGPEHFPGGRLGDAAAAALPLALEDLGFKLGRFKTGTTPRLDGRTIDFAKLAEQPGDPDFIPFSRRSAGRPLLPQRPCFLARTNARTHEIIRSNLQRSALYSGNITATGVRYCPSVEDKIVKFPERDSHHIFVEPEGLDTDRYYPNGLSNSLPLDVQVEMVRSIPGLENAALVQAGYGIEHDYIDPTQLLPSLQAKSVPGLFFAGQINGTTGYEEAAAQGLIAGINAACSLQGREPFILDRSQAYIGVLLDDLVTKGTNEPYRMFTSRVEYRLVLREDNVDERLTPLGYRLGLISQTEYDAMQKRLQAMRTERQRLAHTRLAADPSHEALAAAWGMQSLPAGTTLEELMRRPEMDYAHLARLDPPSAAVLPEVQRRVDVLIKYEGYIRRQEEEIENFQDLERKRIPPHFAYQGLPGLSSEIVEKLSRIRPQTLGQASRISGVTPAAVTLLLLYIKKQARG